MLDVSPSDSTGFSVQRRRKEVDEEIPSPAQQRQLLNAHVNLGHPAIGEFCRPLRNGQCRRGIVRWTKRHFHCPECEARPMTRTRTAAPLPKCHRFKQVCGIDTMEVRSPLGPKKPCCGKVQGARLQVTLPEHIGLSLQLLKLSASFRRNSLSWRTAYSSTGLLATARTCPGGSGQPRMSWATPVESNSEQWPLTE